LFAFSCSNIKSGKYVYRNGKWVWKGTDVGLIQLFNEEDDLNYWSGELTWPVPSIRQISSGYGKRWGRMHHGIDIPARTGTSVVAAEDGRVIYAASKIRGYGKMVIVSHGRGIKTVYAHNSKIMVKKGQKVYRGQVISKVGATGRATGPHLHFEVRSKNKPLNPVRYFRLRLAKK
jgi:murein DD-endopeptidase MepM/ murein hydrolase activator NlpD